MFIEFCLTHSAGLHQFQVISVDGKHSCHWTVVGFGMSAASSKYKIGPRTLSCSTPTDMFFPVSYWFIVYEVFSSALFITFMIRYTCSIFECLFQNPNWCSGISFLNSIVGFNRFKINVSNYFDKLGRSDIGLYEVNCSGGFPGLSRMITCTHFHCLRTNFVHRIALYNLCVRWIIVFLDSPFVATWFNLIDIRIDFVNNFNWSEVLYPFTDFHSFKQIQFLLHKLSKNKCSIVYFRLANLIKILCQIL